MIGSHSIWKHAYGERDFMLQYLCRWLLKRYYAWEYMRWLLTENLLLYVGDFVAGFLCEILLSFIHPVFMQFAASVAYISIYVCSFGRINLMLNQIMMDGKLNGSWWVDFNDRGYMNRKDHTNKCELIPFESYIVLFVRHCYPSGHCMLILQGHWIWPHWNIHL